jgi:hypothetical protein
MAKRPATGRDAVFRGKVDGYRVQGVLTKKGGREFEDARKALALLYEAVTGQRLEHVSDADVIEAMARGVEGTREYLKQLHGKK